MRYYRTRAQTHRELADTSWPGAHSLSPETHVEPIRPNGGGGKVCARSCVATPDANRVFAAHEERARCSRITCRVLIALERYFNYLLRHAHASAREPVHGCDAMRLVRRMTRVSRTRSLPLNKHETNKNAQTHHTHVHGEHVLAEGFIL